MLKWYVIHAYSGHENRAKLSILERLHADERLTGKFGDDILIPPETVDERGKKFFPGYMYVQLDLKDTTPFPGTSLDRAHLLLNTLKNTPKVTGINGGWDNPMAVPPRDIERVRGGG